jgi:hypothetical protein
VATVRRRPRHMVARATATVSRNGLGVVRGRLSRQGLRLLRRRHRLPVRVEVTARNSAGLRSSATGLLTLLRR